jgi:hypothetical protein
MPRVLALRASTVGFCDKVEFDPIEKRVISNGASMGSPAAKRFAIGLTQFDPFRGRHVPQFERSHCL